MRRVTFTYLDQDNDWQEVRRVPGLLSWSTHDPCTINLSFREGNTWLLSRGLLFDGLVCDAPEGVNGGDYHWVEWDNNHIILDLHPPHGYATLRAQKSALAAFLAATVYHEFSSPLLETWWQ